MTTAHKLPRYTERITIDPEIMVGKPVVKGTRITVEIVLKKLAQELDIADILRAYPRLTEDDIRACVEYAEALVEGERVGLGSQRPPSQRAV
jgi:uncharacterized protein (DUF433 family)